ncbi:flagellar hook-length control protein FliK [Pseudomonas sp. PDM13]|uniref:flagellar hook-length control protein FliK n=1 Tax=Pseudomonas sp. PDM13 TaxID=2769255 RepID=UPI0021DFACB8|nr:flagellar hook-length control protein FliK [Pseudomonas sp. PDM13]MCU9948619.1 flagellar hook-length control protein FliK [Pseudomonas sp. PDM13]
MTEISTSRPISATPPASRPVQTVAEAAIKLLQPINGLLSAGESADAEVVSVKESAQNSFQVLLKLTLNGGQQTTVEASSNRPLAQGSLINVTAVSETKLMVALQPGGTAALDSIDLDQLPVGTLVQGKVVSSEQLAEARTTVYRSLINLINTPLAGRQMAVEGPLPLPLGSLLSAQVQSSQSLQFLPLSAQLDQLALTQQLANQQSRQGSLEGLVQALKGMGDELPSNLRGTVDRLLNSLPDAAQLSDSKLLAKAMENSGALLEARLLAGHGAALGQDIKGNLLRLIAQLLPNLPNGPAALPTAGASNAMAQALPAFIRSALGSLGQASARQQALSFPLPSRLAQQAEGEGDLELLLKMAAAAVSRLQTHQLSSLAQSQMTPEGNLLTTWQLELPMRNNQDIVPLQVKVQQEQSPQKRSKEEQKDTLWRIELAFDMEPLGPLQVQAQLLRGAISSQLWAERARTASLIDGELPNLRERLVSAGLEVSELACRQGIPPQGPRTNLQQRWVDETA